MNPTFQFVRTLKANTMRLLIITLLLTISPASFAFSLTPAPDDASVHYLSEIFGRVGNVLMGANNPLIAQIFYGFNYAVIFLACILIVYTLFVSILNTAQDGEMMGKKWSSIWVPLRMVAGLALLLPVSAGYSAMQVIVMWVVLQGVGAADSIWDIGVKGLTGGEGTLNPPTLMTYGSLEAGKSIYKSAESLLSLQVCMDAINATYSGGTGPSCQVQPNGNSNEYQINCVNQISVTVGTSSGYQSTPVTISCGSIIPNYAQIEYPDLSSTGGPSNAGIYAAIQKGMEQMIEAVTPAAQALTDYVGQTLQQETPNVVIPNDAIIQATSAYINTLSDAIAQYEKAVVAYDPQAAINKIIAQQAAIKSSVQSQISAEESSLGGQKVTFSVPTISHAQHASGLYPPCNAQISQQFYKSVAASMHNALSSSNNINVDQGGTGSSIYATMLNANIASYESEFHCDPLANSHPKNTVSQMESTGWFNAGQYYLVLAERSFLQANSSALAGKAIQVPALEAATPIWSVHVGPKVEPYYAAVVDYERAQLASLRANAPNAAPAWMAESSAVAPPNDPSGAIVAALNIAMSQWTQLYNQLSGYVYGGSTVVTVTPKVLQQSTSGTLCWGLNGFGCTDISFTGKVESGRKKYQDPFLAIQHFGAFLLDDSIKGFENTGLWFSSQEAEEWWKYAIPTGSIWGNQQIDNMIEVAWYLPVGVAILGMLMSAGIMLGIYMPLIPFILFTLGAIGWLLGVVEAMVAAPIVCFGLMHPNGQNEVVSKAEPAIMLLINTFIRPGLMVVGLLISIALVYVCISVVNDGFAQVMSSIVTYGGDMSGAYVTAGLMAIYGLFLVLIIQKCFSLVTLIPDSVLRWIQGGEAAREQFGGFEDIGQQMGQKVGSGASSASQAAGQTGTQQATGQESIAGNAQKKEDGLLIS